MVRLQVLSSAHHRRFWNILLLFFFLSTALLGLLLVVKVNYKLDISWVESAIQWHVDLGIGFAIVAVFHLSGTWATSESKCSPDLPARGPPLIAPVTLI